MNFFIWIPALLRLFLFSMLFYKNAFFIKLWVKLPWFHIYIFHHFKHSVLPPLIYLQLHYIAFCFIILAISKQKPAKSCKEVQRLCCQFTKIQNLLLKYIIRNLAIFLHIFKESVTLSCMAHDLGCSPYVLSRVFSGTFHRNFNQYLNSVRLDYACALLKHTSQPITEILLNSGFESQRTFNRVFREFYHMSPREYRQNIP